jgi:hypothetical protein
MRRLRRAGLSLFSVAACFSLAATGHAQSGTKTALAEGLYRQARDLMAAGKLDEACPKFAESQRLDPATGTLLNLAACHERQGKLATAWLEYSDVIASARRDGRQDRVDYATERVAALEPRLSRLTLVLAAGDDDPSLLLELDGASFGRAAIGAPTPVDPGKHTVRASAPGKKPWQQEITIGAEADQQSLTIPRLEDAPIAVVPAPTASVHDEPLTKPVALNGPASDTLGSRPIPQSVYLAGGITVALAIGAGVTGATYWNKRTTYHNALQKADRTQGPTEQLRTQERSAERWGYANLGFWAATACGAGVTTYLFLTRPTRATTARVVPLLGPGHIGLGLTGEL